MLKIKNQFLGLRLKNFILSGAFIILASFLIVAIARAVDTTELSQVISAGSIDVSIVDANGDVVGSPSASFSGANFSFDISTTTATLGTASEKIRLSNPTATADWSVTFAATGGATSAWNDGGSNYIDFNDQGYSEETTDDDNYRGLLLVNPSGGTIAGVAGCATTNVSLGSSSSFEEGVTDSITLYSASSAATFCRWDLTGVALTQVIGTSTPAGTYTLDMTLTAA